MGETSDEEVDYGSFESIANPSTESDHAWSTSENDSQDYKWQGYLVYWLEWTKGAGSFSRYMRKINFNYFVV